MIIGEVDRQPDAPNFPLSFVPSAVDDFTEVRLYDNPNYHGRPRIFQIAHSDASSALRQVLASEGHDSLPAGCSATSIHYRISPIGFWMATEGIIVDPAVMS